MRDPGTSRVDVSNGPTRPVSDSASVPQTMLKALVREKYLSSYRRFKRAYQEAARRLDKDLVDSYPSDATYKRWLTGRVKNLPRSEHCAVLEAMFPGWTAADLFAAYVPPDRADNSTLLRELLRRRHLQTYRAFCQAYDKAAMTLDKKLIGTYPAERQFYRWISGDMIGLPYPDHCNVLEIMFPGYSARQLFEPHGELQSVKADESQDGADVDAQRKPLSESTTLVGSENKVLSESEIVMDTPERVMLTASTVDLEAVLMAAADKSTTFLEWVDASNVGDLTIDQIQSDIRRLARSYLKVPTVPLFDRTRALRDRVITLLKGHQKPTLSRELHGAAGWSLTVLAWISTDLGFPEAAENHLRAAWICADHADQDNLRAWVRATQHTAAFWQDDFAKAAQYAEDGLRYATNGTSALFLASAWALDLARKGDRDQAELALAQAHNFADSADSRTDELAGPFTCSIGRAGGFWSDSYLAMDQPHKALDLASEAVSVFESTPSDIRNFGSERMVRCQQVKGHLILGEYDGASEAIAPILETAPRASRSATCQAVRRNISTRR